jgi:L-aminopeptidase/D-esterase-like protein
MGLNAWQRRDGIEALNLFIRRIEPTEQSIDGDNAVALGTEFAHNSRANEASSAGH